MGEGNGTPFQYSCLENPMAEKPGWLQSMRSGRVGHHWATSLSLFTFLHWRRKWQPTPVFLPGESQGWGSLVGCRLWGRTESDTTGDLAAAAVNICLSQPPNLPDLHLFGFLFGNHKFVFYVCEIILMKMIIFLSSQLPGIKEHFTEWEALVLMFMCEAAPLPSSPSDGSGRKLTSDPEP